MQPTQRTYADELREIPTKAFWIGVFLIVLVGAGLTPWDAIKEVIEEGGVGEPGQQLIGFVAGYTLPLTIGLGIVFYMLLVGGFKGMDPLWGFALIAGILFISGLAAGYLGLGRLPEYSPTLPSGGPPVQRILMWVVSGYVNAYGWALALCSAAIAFAAAVHVERLGRSES